MYCVRKTLRNNPRHLNSRPSRPTRPKQPEEETVKITVVDKIPKNCPECSGNVIVERDRDGAFGSCIMCGFMMEEKPEPKRNTS